MDCTASTLYAQHNWCRRCWGQECKRRIFFVFTATTNLYIVLTACKLTVHLQCRTTYGVCTWYCCGRCMHTLQIGLTTLWIPHRAMGFQILQNSKAGGRIHGLRQKKTLVASQPAQRKRNCSWREKTRERERVGTINETSTSSGGS